MRLISRRLEAPIFIGQAPNCDNDARRALQMDARAA